MQPYLRRSLLIALALATGACHDADAAHPLSGASYTGAVKARVSPPGEAVIADRGRGTARFTPDGKDRARLSVRGAIADPDGDAGFDIPGAFNGDAWRGTWGDVGIEIGPSGRISGGGISDGQRFAFSGQATPGDFDLVVDIELLAANKGGLPRGTQMQFSYDLARATPPARKAAPGERGSRADTSNCRKIRYEVRPRPNVGDGTMTMTRVPVCRD